MTDNHFADADMRRPARKVTVIGWREYIDLPELGLKQLRAKIDTGALTTALHAHNMRVFDMDGARWVEFRPPGAGSKTTGLCRFPVHDERMVKNTSGIPELRVVIRTSLVIAGRRWKIDLSLTDRTNMLHPIIIGRSAIRRHGLLVDSGRSFLTGKPDRNPAHGKSFKRREE